MTNTQTATKTGTNVKGIAAVGDVVSYEDMSNFGYDRTVTALPTATKWGMSGYTLVDADGNVTTSDLRQHGWTFA